MTIQIKIGKEVLKYIIFNKELTKFLGEQEQLHQLLFKFLSYKKRNLKHKYKDMISISKIKKIEKANKSIQTKYLWDFLDITLANDTDEQEVFDKLMDYFSSLYCLKSFPKKQEDSEFKEFNYFKESRIISAEDISEALDNSHGFKTKPELYNILKHYKIFLSITRI